jgi:hypothetical protein
MSVARQALHQRPIAGEHVAMDWRPLVVVDVRRTKMMDISTEIVEESIGVLPEYGRIPISFEVRSVIDVQLLEGGLKGIRLSGSRVRRSGCAGDSPSEK